jgi:alpha-galactosidase
MHIHSRKARQLAFIASGVVLLVAFPANAASNTSVLPGSPTATAAAAVVKSSAAGLTLDVAGIDHERILKAALAALATEPIIIANFRAELSEGGANDFYSNGDYWWPDPTKTNGLPYIQRDGESNPNNFNQHRRCIAQLHETVAAFGAAYKITGDDRYVSKAVELLRVFFLDPKTRMNPHLKYAQAIPGRTPGRGTGIIDTLHLIEVPVAIAALQKSPAFPPEVLTGLKEWFRQYAEWMATSKNGQDEAAATNNHSVAFYLQLAAFAEFAGDDARVAECRRRFKEVFVPKQMAADGSFPAELKRTKPYGYSIFQLDNMVTLCQLLSTEQDNLWSFALPDGRGIRKAVEFLYPYLADKSTWPRQPDIQAWNGWPARQPALLFAGLAFGEQKYLDLWQKLPADPVDPEVRRNIAITQPLLWLKPVPQAKAVASGASAPAAERPPQRGELRTPSAPPTPRINGPSIFGVRPGSPFLYHIPATGERPMEFSVEGLPAGLQVAADTGEISGVLKEPGRHLVTLRARNAKGTAGKKFRIVVGETITLTPPMGWNSWNCWGSKVDAEKVLKSARGLVASGLINHGWTYMNIDDAWQGKRGGPFHAIQGNEKFPDMKGLCDTVHQMGLKIGIYSTPWVTSYATYIGGSAENPEGTWSSPTIPKRGNVNKKILPWAIGKYHFATNDAKQWAAWGIDYLKYDWNPNELPETQEMYDALRKSGRDVIFSLSNNSPFTNAPALSKIANCWRTTGDIRDNWDSMSKKGFGEDKWERFAAPGHWNDPDMLVVGRVGWGSPHPTKLTPDEQYTHISLWCLLSAPLLLGCDLDQLDDFMLNLLTNDEVLAVNQDALSKQALCVVRDGDLRVYAKDLEDGSKAVGLFNLGADTASVTVKWSDLRLSGRQSVRDLWRQKDVGAFGAQLQLPVAGHGAELVKLTPAQ